jgi:GT2 family glycosyltransferase
VILLNDDLEVIAPDWIQALASQAARPGVGAVGGKLLFPDGSLQHAGIALGFHGSAGHVFHRAPERSDYAGFASIDRNYSAVTGAVMAYRKEVFDEVGGFDLRFSTDYNDLDFCLKCIEAGLRVVYTPSAKLYHFHNSSLNRAHDNAEEKEAFLQKWGALVARDPYFNKHFQKDSHDRPLLGA